MVKVARNSNFGGQFSETNLHSKINGPLSQKKLFTRSISRCFWPLPIIWVINFDFHFFQDRLLTYQVLNSAVPRSTLLIASINIVSNSNDVSKIDFHMILPLKYLRNMD